MLKANLRAVVGTALVVASFAADRLVYADETKKETAPTAKKVDEPTIRALIKQLGDDSYVKREAAGKRLAEIGEPAVDLLQKAALDSPDAEVRSRAKDLARVITASFLQEVRRYEGHAQEARRHATRVAVSADGRFAVSAGTAMLRYWNIESGKQISAFGATLGKSFWALSLSADGKRVIAGGQDNLVRIFELPSGKQLQQLAGHTGCISGAYLLADGKRAVSSALDRSIRLWNVETGKEILMFDNIGEQIRNLAISPDGKTLATASCKEIDRSPGLVRFWDIDTGKMLKVMEGHPRNTSNVCFARDGKTLLSSGYDGSLRIWDLATGKELKKFEAAPQGIEAAAITPDGRHVLSGGNPSNPTLRMWEVASGKLVFESEEMAGGFLGMAAMPNSNGCLTATRDGVIRLWQWKR